MCGLESPPWNVYPTLLAPSNNPTFFLVSFLSGSASPALALACWIFTRWNWEVKACKQFELRMIPRISCCSKRKLNRCIDIPRLQSNSKYFPPRWWRKCGWARSPWTWDSSQESSETTCPPTGAAIGACWIIWTDTLVLSKKSIKRKDLQGSGQLPIRNHRLRLHFLVGDLVRKSPFEIQNFFRPGQKGFKVEMQIYFEWYSLIGGARIRMSPCPWCWTWGEEPFDRCWRTCDKNSHYFMQIRY